MWTSRLSEENICQKKKKKKKKKNFKERNKSGKIDCPRKNLQKKKKKKQKEKAQFLKKKNEGKEDGEERDSENEDEVAFVPSKFLSGWGDSSSDLDFQNFLKEHNITVSSSEEENESEAETVTNENLDQKKGNAVAESISGKLKEDKRIIKKVMKLFTAMSEKVFTGNFLKLMYYYKDALDHFIIEPADGGMPEKVQEENKRKRQKKTKKSRTKNKLSMHTDTALFIIFNVIYNIDSIFCNLTNGTHDEMQIWSVERIKEKEIFEETEEEEEEEKEKEEKNQGGNEQDQDASKKNKEWTRKACSTEKAKVTEENNGTHGKKCDILNIEKYPNFKKYNLLIQAFFHSLGNKLKHIGENELLDGIFKLLRRRNVLRWLIPNRLGVYFLSKLVDRFIVSKKNETYFLIFVTIRNLFSLYSEKRETLYSVYPSESEAVKEKHEKYIYLYEKDIFAMYQQIFRLYLLHYGKNYGVHNLRHIYFKENCLSELFTLLPNDIKYFFVFRYIQLIIQKIRASYKIFIVDPSKKGDKENKDKGKKKDTVAKAGDRKEKCINLFTMKQFHLRSSYMILLLHFLAKIVTTCDYLDVLSCGMATVIIALLKMSLHIMKYVPYNLQLINMLIRLIENKKKYIPLFSYFTCILNGLQKCNLNKASSQKKFDVKKLEQFDINISVEIDESAITEFAILHQIYDKIYVLLYDYIGLMAQSVSFPEFFILIDAYFKNYCCKCKVSHFRTNIKKLLADAKSSIKMITQERKNVNIYSVNETIKHLENEDFPIVKERLKVLQNYENMNLRKIEATLLGLESIKNEDDYDKHMKSIYEASEEEKENVTDKKEKNKKNKKRTRADILVASEQSNENKDLKKKKKYTPLPETDGLENFSFSSDNEL